MKRKIAVLLICILGIVCLTACFPSHDKAKELLGTNDLPKQPVEADWFFNKNSLELCVGNAGYVFVGQATDYIRTEHDDGTPYTFYKLKVLENLKGNLRTDVDIVFRKEGGITKSGRRFWIYEGDALPKIGNYYVFILRSMDGIGLFAGGPNTNLPLKLPDGDYHDEANYKKTLLAIENQEVPPGSKPNSVSEYDVDYQA